VTDAASAIEEVTGRVVDFRRSGDSVEVDIQSDSGRVVQLLMSPVAFREEFVCDEGRADFDLWWGSRPELS
jgi:hypothetical protein